MARLYLPFAALVAMVVVCFAPVLAIGGFPFDDATFVRDNPLLHDWAGLVELWWPQPVVAGTYGVDHHYWPVLYTTFWIEHKLWGGFWGPGFHATNVVLHAVGACLLWRILLRLGVPGAFVAASLFAIHPSQMEAVAVVIGRKDVLSTLLVLVALRVWIGTAPTGALPSWPRVASVTAVGAVAVLAKTPSVLLLPAFILLVHWWRAERWSGALALRLVALALPLLVLAGWAWYAYESELIRGHYDMRLGFVEHLVLGPMTWWAHLYFSVVPDPAGLGWLHWSLDLSNLWVWAALLGLLALVVLLWVKRGVLPRGVPIALVGFTLSVAPYLGVLDHQGLLGSFTNSRHRYLAALFPWLLIVGGWLVLRARIEAAGWARLVLSVRRFGIVGVGVSALFMHWTYGFVYTSDAAWYSHLERVSAGSSFPVGLARYKLVPALLEAGRVQEALAAAERWADLYPESPLARMTLALAAEATGDLSRAHSMLLDLIGRWNHPEQRRELLGPDLSRDIRDGGTGPWPLSLPARYVILLALARIDHALGDRESAAQWAAQAQWIIPRDRLWAFQRADGSVYQIGGKADYASPP